MLEYATAFAGQNKKYSTYEFYVRFFSGCYSHIFMFIIRKLRNVSCSIIIATSKLVDWLFQTITDDWHVI